MLRFQSFLGGSDSELLSLIPSLLNEDKIGAVRISLFVYTDGAC